MEPLFYYCGNSWTPAQQRKALVRTLLKILWLWFDKLPTVDKSR
jgi:hypothetical protein